jgi:hypothetical protein
LPACCSQRSRAARGRQQHAQDWFMCGVVGMRPALMRGEEPKEAAARKQSGLSSGSGRSTPPPSTRSTTPSA